MKHTKWRRPPLPVISEEMKAWSTALADEVGGWPQVDTRPFFGFTALYRGDKMFAALPRTRGVEAASSLAFKLETPASSVSTRLQRDARIRNWSKPMQEARWFTFEIPSHSDLHDALDWWDAPTRPPVSERNRVSSLPLVIQIRPAYT